MFSRRRTFNARMDTSSAHSTTGEPLYYRSEHHQRKRVSTGVGAGGGGIFSSGKVIAGTSSDMGSLRIPAQLPASFFIVDTIVDENDVGFPPWAP